MAESSWRGRAGRFWPHLRATLIGVALLVSVVMLLPGGSRMRSRQVWKTDHNQAQFAQWAKTLSALGWQTTPAEFESSLWRSMNQYASWQRPLASALAPVVSQAGIAQTWRMFSTPQTHPARLHIDVDRGGGFEALYVSRSDDHRWRRGQFDHNRLRKLVGRLVRKGRDRSYQHFVEWVGRAVAHDFPDARRVRVRLFRWATPEPRQQTADYTSGGKFDSMRVVNLEQP